MLTEGAPDHRRRHLGVFDDEHPVALLLAGLDEIQHARKHGSPDIFTRNGDVDAGPHQRHHGLHLALAAEIEQLSGRHRCPHRRDALQLHGQHRRPLGQEKNGHRRVLCREILLPVETKGAKTEMAQLAVEMIGETVAAGSHQPDRARTDPLGLAAHDTPFLGAPFAHRLPRRGNGTCQRLHLTIECQLIGFSQRVAFLIAESRQRRILQPLGDAQQTRQAQASQLL